MLKRALTIAMAFVGLSIGAGFASGQELLQFFVAFGVPGLIGAVVTALLMCLVGIVILQLGSYFQATEHSAVLAEYTHPVFAKIFDAAVMLTVFSIAMVMFAGAGANLNQQFDLPTWVGSVGLLLLVLALGSLDVDKVSKVIGAATPFIVLFIVIAAVYSITHADADFATLEAATKEIDTELPNIFIGVASYVGFSLMVVVSMSIVIGGEYLVPRTAGLGGLMGGFIFGSLLVLSVVSLFLKIEQVGHLDMPMLGLVGLISPAMGVAMSVVIFAMIFNSALGMSYAMGRRLSAGHPERFKKMFYLTVIVAFFAGFLGFKRLVSYLFPVLGYIGAVLTVVLIIAWIKDHHLIRKEIKRRVRIRDLVTLQLHPEMNFTKAHQRELDRRVAASNIEDDDLARTVQEEVVDKLVRDSNVDFTEEDGLKALGDDGQARS
ncbi:YkvI family membrane protein [Corynebacterium aquilae]|uniref:YkvI family membrane protein n=1 Tax=Corynebacterium aquilae TaxID=203263 RepID=UPI0012EE1D27|nr:hypothetical protein [Corynebacterium aquilae]